LNQPERLGPFGRVSHPENLAIILVVWPFPRMTVNRLTLAGWATLYAVVGSWHEDVRLAQAYGEAFARYRRATPMLVPRFGGVPTKAG
jgi:protein-S-isoprenylcysteine O-methyltransferase Ste14